MTQSFLVTLLRNIKRNSLYTIINILGLTIGIAVCILILLFLRREFSYDAYHQDADRIYQVLRYQIPPNGGEEYYSRGVKGAVGPALAAEIPEIQSVTRFITRPMWAGTEDRGFVAQGTIADTNFLDFFTFPTISGQKISQIPPNSIYVTEGFARKLFGSTDVIGKSIYINYKWLKGDFQIAEVLRDAPGVTSSMLRFDFVVNRSAIITRWVQSAWETWNQQYLFINTFIRLAPAATPENLRKKLDVFASHHLGISVAEREPYDLLSILRLHLYGHHDFKMASAKEEPGDIYQCYAFSLVGGFLLLIACINFINLSTARATDRALEVGIRKVVGATRTQLVIQFLIEIMMLALLSGLLALGVVEVVLPWVNALLALKLEFTIWALIFCAITTIFAGLAAGLYPAFFLSDFQPAQVLKGSHGISTGQSWFRKFLVVGQFSIAVALITTTLIVYAQMKFINTTDLGFRKEGLIITPFFEVNEEHIFDQFKSIRNRFLAHPNIDGFTASSYLPGKKSLGDRILVKKPGITDSVNIYNLNVDDTFTEVFDISIVDGRAFRESDLVPRGNDKYLLINQTASQRLGGIEPGDAILVRGKEFIVIGIFEDFFYDSLHGPIVPLMLRYWFPNYNYITLDVGSQNLSETIDFIESIWREYLSNRPFEYQFMDEYLQDFYKEEYRTQEAFLVLSVLTIATACLGLFGLIAHTTRRRTKEIGIRKVLGASTLQIVFLLTRDLGKLIVLAIFIAWPIAYFSVRNWIERFAYRYEPGIGIFLAGATLALTFALSTLIFQTIKAAQENPANSLRDE